MKTLPVSAMIGLTLLFAGTADANVSIVPTPKRSAPAPVTPTQQPQPGAHTGEDAVQELMREQQQRQEAYESINRLNPMGEAQLAPSLSKDEQQVYEQALQDPDGFLKQNEQALRRLQRLMEMPAMKSYTKLISNPAVADNITLLMEHPKRKNFLVTNAILFFAFLLFRAWRNSKATHWAQRFWVNIYSLVGFWGIAVIGVPWLMFGEPYRVLISEIYRTLFG